MKNPRVMTAFAFGFALVLGAYTISDFSFNQPAAQLPDQTVSVIASKAPARQYIQTDDSNNDGVPDWQELLNNTTPLAIDEVAVATFTPPTTLTDQFALEFFEGMVRDKSYGDFSEGSEAQILAASEVLAERVQDELYTITDIKVYDQNTRTAWHAYGNAAAQIVIDHSVPEGTATELEIVEEAVARNDAARLAELQLHIDSYTAIRDGLLKTPVPEGLIKEHLDVTNAVNAMLSNLAAMEQFFDDPLLALLRVRRYQDDLTGLVNASINLQEKMKAAGVVYTEEEPAYQLIIIQ